MSDFNFVIMKTQSFDDRKMKNYQIKDKVKFTHLDNTESTVKHKSIIISNLV